MEEVSRSKFISVRNLLEDIGYGIGKANYSLWKESSSPVGMLVVKNAKVTIDFEMTSSAVDRAESLSLGGSSPVYFLGAKTLTVSSDVSSKEDRSINHAQITLEIVSVVPESSEKPDSKLKENLSQAVNLLRNRLTDLKISEKAKKNIIASLNNVEELLNNNKIEEARNALTNLAQEYSINV